MSKNNKLRALVERAEDKLLNSSWGFAKVSLLSQYITKRLDKHEYNNYVGFLQETLASLNYEDGVGKIAAEAVGRGTLETLFTNKFASRQPLPSYAKTLIRVAIKSAYQSAKELSQVVGVQPITAPASMVFAMTYVKSKTHEGRLNLEVISKTAEAATRKLNAGWDVESTRVLMTLHGVNIEEELERILVSETTHCIISDVLSELQNGVEAGYSLYYSPDSPANEKVFNEIMQLSNDIARTTRRGGASFLICPPHFVSALQAMRSVVFSPAVDGSFIGDSIKYAGIVNGTTKVYSHIWTDGEDKVILGYKGNGEVDTGFIYSPYCITTPGVVINPTTFTPFVSISSRAGIVKNDGDTFKGSNYYRVLKLP